MTYRKYGINPMLISLATGKDLSEIPPSPTGSKLPNLYGKLVYKNLAKMPKVHPENKFQLTCAECGQNAQYDLGLIVVNPEKRSASEMKNEDPSEMPGFQYTGYFRCRHCNSAGSWVYPNSTKSNLMFAAMGGMLSKIADSKNKNVEIATLSTLGGDVYPWATDVEDAYLAKLKDNPRDAWNWNRLGNSYYKGGRPDLAAVAFEESIKNDAGQVESLFSLGQLLYEADELEAAAPYLRQALIFARDYDELEPKDLRDMLTNALFLLLEIVGDLDTLMKSIPTADDFPGFRDRNNDVHTGLQYLELSLSLNSFKGLYPLAEAYMGKQQNKLPLSAQTLKHPSVTLGPQVVHPNKKKPPKRKGKRKK